MGRLSGRPLRRRDGETIEDFTFRTNDIFKVCPLEREWSVATTNFFKMDFFHAWLEGLRSKYLTSIVLSMMETSSTDSKGQLTVEKAVHSLRQIARQEDLIRQLAIEREGRVTPPYVLDNANYLVDREDASEWTGRWSRGVRAPGGCAAKIWPKRRVNEKSMFVRIVKVNPEEHDEHDLDADGTTIWI